MPPCWARPRAESLHQSLLQGTNPCWAVGGDGRVSRRLGVKGHREQPSRCGPSIPSVKLSGHPLWPGRPCLQGAPCCCWGWTRDPWSRDPTAALPGLSPKPVRVSVSPSTVLQEAEAAHPGEDRVEVLRAALQRRGAHALTPGHAPRYVPGAARGPGHSLLLGSSRLLGTA